VLVVVVVAAVARRELRHSPCRSAAATLGTVTSDLAGINCGNACSAKFVQGTVVTVTATPPAGKTFASWGGACSGTAPTCSVTIAKDTSVQANFNK
jgi:hypothetical protein